MGVGTPSDILGAVKRGIDMFDCVLPTRSGEQVSFTWQWIELILRIINTKQTILRRFQICNNLNLNKYSKNYLNHLS